MLTCVDVFSGIGGMALAAQNAGFELKLLVEIEPYCRSVLEKHFPGVPIIGDVHDVGVVEIHGKRSKKGVAIPQIGRIDDLTLITGDFPFQANNSRGTVRRGDPRSLWDQFARVVSEARPAWVVASTVPRLLHLGLDDAAWDLERAGYAVTAFVLPAHAVDCPLRKDRLYLVGARSEDPRAYRERREPGRGVQRWPVPEPGVCRVAERLPDGLDTHLVRLLTLGDATLHGSAFQVLNEIAETERDWQSTAKT